MDGYTDVLETVIIYIYKQVPMHDDIYIHDIL